MEGERALGLDSELLSTTRNWLAYPADIELGLENVSGNLAKFLKLARAFASVRNRYDVFHFNAGTSLLHSIPYRLNHLDIPYYPASAKLFVTYNGCDARQKFPTIARTEISACRDPKCYHGMCHYGAYDSQRRQSIEKISRYVRHIWAVNPDLLHFLPADKSSFLPYSVSWEGLHFSPPRLGSRLKIVHAPTNREAKGSGFVLAALERLRAKYPDSIEIVLVENVPHRQALEIYKDCDLVVDQVLVGWYGGLSVETMRMGKPVIARIALDDLRFIPAEMACDVRRTIINADPRTIYDVLERCVGDTAFLRERAQLSSEYAAKWHDPKYVAGLTKQKYETA